MKNGVLKTDHKTLHLDILTSVSQAVVFIVHFSASFFSLTPSFFPGLSGDTSKRKAVIADRVSH